MPPEKLPETFEIQTTMHLNDEDWSIVEAIPSHSKDFLESKELTLKMNKVESMNPQDILFSLPTISNEIPQKSPPNIYNDFDFLILEDDWRQNEFLNKSAFPLIEIEIKKINELKQNDSKVIDSEFTAFKNCHVRDTIGEPKLSLSLEQIKKLLNTENLGNLKTSSNFIENGFSLRTKSTTFYGTIENGIITQFCIGEFSDGTSNEIQKIINELDILFVGWCHCQIIEPND